MIYYTAEVIDKILHLYEGGMFIIDISTCLSINPDEINNILDSILPYI